MAFFQLILKARKLEKAKLRYEDEKLRSIEISKGAKPRYTLKQRVRLKKLWLKKKVTNFFSKILSVPKDAWLYRKVVAIRMDGTLENYVAKSLFGFFGGIFLTYIFFVFFVLQLKFRLSSATMLCTAIGVILTLGLAFSLRVRCIVFLLLPQFFSKRGRQALVAYAFILALTGPVKNTLHNTGVLSESLTCVQAQLKEAVKTVVDLAKQPFYALREAISKVMKSVKAVVKRIKQTLIAIKRIVLSILKVITAVFQWLGSVINMCNKKLGTPFDRCQSVFEGAVADCKAKLGPIVGLVCNLTYIVGALCYVVKPLDFICMLVSYIADTVVGAVRTKIKRFTMHMKAMFYVKVKFSHSFHFETNQSKAIEEVSTGIVTEIRSRTDKFFGFFNWMSFITSIFAFIIVLKVLRYRYKWLTSDRYDNQYITDDLRTIDLIRARQDKETILPLNPRERRKYAPLSSVILVKSERTRLARSAVFLTLATIKLIAYMAIDYSLYWMLYTIQLYGRFQSKVEQPHVVSVHVSGDGYLADLYKSIVKAFSPHGKEAEVDTLLCLPEPVPPDLDKYTQIVALIIFYWFIAIFEPYGLRLRNVVMCKYYPDRAKQRAAWLYNHIMRSRGSFLKFVRRQLRRKFGLAENGRLEKTTFKERLWATCPFLNIFFPLKKNVCLLCSAVERPDNPHIKCSTPGCVGLFCAQCFADLQNTCTICRSPIDYGDLSDISEEKDSSDDEFPVVKEKVEKKSEIIEEASTVETEDEEVAEEKEEQMEEKGAKEEKVEIKEEEEKGEEEKTKQIEEPTKIEKDVAEQTDEKYVEDSDRSSVSSYSYTYQDESPQEVEMETRREPFRDIEAQTIRDDVTIQIFNEPFVKESSGSSCDSPSCFVVRARRKVRARLKKRPEEDCDSSTSIADTESWSTEEVEEEEVIHIEVDDNSEELLSKDKKKQGRINRIVAAVARIPWLGKEKSNGKVCQGLQTKRPSLMGKIVSMLQRKESMPVQTYKRSRKLKNSSSSPSLSSSSDDDESKVLLRAQNKSTDTRYQRKKKCRREMMTGERDERKDLNMERPCQKMFATKQMPRYLESTTKGTCYFEVNETEDSRRARKCVRQVKDVNEISGGKTSSDSRTKDKWNVTEDDEFLSSCSCTSKNTYETSSDLHLSEQINDTSKTMSETGIQDVSTVSESGTEDAEEVTNLTKGSKQQEGIKETLKYRRKVDDSSKYMESKDLEKMKEETKETKKSVQEQTRMRGGSTKGNERMIHKETEKTSVPTEQDTNQSVSQEQTGEASTGSDASPLTDSLKNSNKKTEESIIQKLKKQFTKVDDTTKKGIIDVPVQRGSKVDKATDLPDKSRHTQTKFRKRDVEKKRKNAEQDIEDVDVKKSTEHSKKISKEGEERKTCSAGKKRRKKKYRSEKDSRVKRSKYEELSCFEKSALVAKEKEEMCRCETKPCHSYLQRYQTHAYGRSPSRPHDDLTFQMPMVKKYLPMYQSPELIEELKRHDRLRLIREREAKRHRLASSLRFSDSTSMCFRISHERTDRIATQYPSTSSKLMSQDERLPYQETQAYRNVLRELQKRTMRQKGEKKPVDSIPLIRLSNKADKTKKVEQLYPPQNQIRKKSDEVKKFTNKIIASLKPISCKKHKRRSRRRNLIFKQMDTTRRDYSFDPEFLSDMSSGCNCSKQTHESGGAKITNKTTDNESDT